LPFSQFAAWCSTSSAYYLGVFVSHRCARVFVHIKVPLKIRAKGPGQFKSNASIGHSSMECWNQADMDVSGGTLAHLIHAGNPCRYDEDCTLMLCGKLRP